MNTMSERTVSDLDNPTAIQCIVQTAEQAEAMLQDLEELPVEDEDRWALTLEMGVEDLPHVREELRGLTADDGGA